MLSSSDVVVFLGSVKPFFESLRMTRKMLRDQKKILLCMGSKWRWGRNQLIEQADKWLRNYKIVLGGADMFLPLDLEHPETHEQRHFDAVDEDEVAYLPVVRSFEEIESKFGLCKQDQAALEAFAVPKQQVIFTHVPTSETNKGSVHFYRAITRAQQACRNLIFTSVRQQTWFATLSILSKTDVLMDQAPPFPTAYGALSVEAAIFRIPSFSQVDPDCRKFIKRHTGLDTPYIVFEDDEDLFKKTVIMARQPETRRMFGDLNYEYCKQLHDEKPVVDRFMKIVEDMA